MKAVLKDIQTGEYAKSFIIENRARRADAAIAPPSDRRAPDRAGRREAARDDAVDREEQAGRPVEELSAAYVTLLLLIRSRTPDKPSRVLTRAAFAILRFYKNTEAHS